MDIILEQKISNVAKDEDDQKYDEIISENENDNFDVLLDAVEGRIIDADGNEEEEKRS